MMPTEINPIYRTESANSPVELGTHQVILIHDGRSEPLRDANFSLRLLPFPRLVISMQLPLHVRIDEVATVEIPAFSARFSAVFSHVHSINSETSLTMHPNPDYIEVVRAKPTKLKEVTFHVINFYNFNGGKNDLILQIDTSMHKSMRRLGRIELEAAGWRVTIHALPETESLVSALGSEGGYAITHVGRIERVRRGYFKPAQAESVIEALRLFLSFARGGFVSCSLAVGYDGFRPSWEQWGFPMIYPWGAYPGWFSGRPAKLLEEAFPGFFSLCKNAHWKRSLRSVLYWYLRSNNSSNGAGVDGGIILSQAALEKLAWVYLVEDAKVLTAHQFESLGPASKKISELLIRLDIPRDIPTELRKLRKVARGNKWIGGPTAIAGIRNDLVHAQARYLRGRRDPFFETWSLAQRYIELIILRIANYHGLYSDRISAKWVGETTKVPWS